MSHCLLAQQCKALSEPARLRILELLPMERDCRRAYNVSRLSEALGIPQPTVSHHLRILFQAGLVQCAKMCRDVYYWIDQPAVEAVMAALREVVRHESLTESEKIPDVVP